jgi:hypothetical protein
LLTSLSATVSAAEAVSIREAHVCNYINGADRDDLMSARDVLVKQMAKLDTKWNSFLWTPLSGTADIDFIWFDVYENLSAWGAVSDKFITSGAGEVVATAFEKIVKCSSSLSSSQQFYTGSGQVGSNPPVTITASSCKLRHGQTMTQVQDLLTHIKVALPQTGAHEDFAGYINVPLATQADVDVRFFGVYNSVSDYAAGVMAIGSTEAGQMLGRHFEQVLDCRASLWLGERIIEN